MTPEELAKLIGNFGGSEFSTEVLGKFVFITHRESGKEFVVSVVQLFDPDGPSEMCCTGSPEIEEDDKEENK